MSTLKDAIGAIRKILLLTEKVNNTGKLLSALSAEVRSHDRRLIRIETMIEISSGQPRLPASD